MSSIAVSSVLHRSRSIGAARLVMVALAEAVDPRTGQTGTDAAHIAAVAKVHPNTVRRSIKDALEAGELRPHPAGGYRITLATDLGHVGAHLTKARYRFGSCLPPEPAA